MMKRNIPSFLIGLLCGAVLVGGSVVYATGIMATPSTHKVYVDGQYTPVDAYLINGNNYFKIRDIAEAVDFAVTWDGSVQIDTTKGYDEEVEETISSEVSSPSMDVNEVRNKIAAMVNEVRADKGVHGLTIDSDLMEAAQVRATEIVEGKLYSHTRPDGRSFGTVVNYTGKRYFGENIGAKDMRYDPLSDLPEQQITGWVNSSAHYNNMIKETYHSMGVGVMRDDFGVYFVVLLLAGGDYTITSIDSPAIN